LLKGCPAKNQGLPSADYLEEIFEYESVKTLGSPGKVYFKRESNPA
jgi:hypothetical protein